MNRWICTVLIALSAVLALCAVAMYVVDPYQRFRAATWFEPDYYNGEEGYNNAGLARNFDYDTIIIGSSMTENTRPTLVDATFGTHSIKLPFEGAMACNHAETMNVAFATHDVRNVFYGMDLYTFVEEPGFSKFVMPSYLYDMNPFSSIEYLLNGEILFHRVPALMLRNLRDDRPPKTRDTMYEWGSSSQFGREITLSSYDFSTPRQPMRPADAFQNNVLSNFDLYVRPFLEQHPNTEFVVFFPPYSALEWYIMLQKGNLLGILRTKELLTERLLAYPNVQLHDFTANLEWVENLDLYTDYSHHAPEVNDQIVGLLAEGTFRLHTLGEAQANNQKLLRVATTFPVPQP